MNAPRAQQALDTINAQRRADEIVCSVRDGALDADALAVAIAPLHGRDLQAFARAVVKALAAV